MQDRNLFKISLIMSTIGTFLILLLSEYSEVELTNIGDLNKNQLEMKVKVSGTVISARETPGLYILSIRDSTATIPIVIFKEDPLSIGRNAQIEVTGKLTEYKNELEIIAEIIRI
ncbi:OB-fold nucleic acid binding domain-containing protein [Candidatus Woesearchaeota archaeon]|nr:OB-fold nucleic acid binding domain-containing protein [Candidatus Woesearchaeota archaeon]